MVPVSGMWAPDDELASERQTLLHLFGQAQDPCRLIDRRLILSPFTIDLAKCLFPLLPKVDGRIRQVPFEDLRFEDFALRMCFSFNSASSSLLSWFLALGSEFRVSGLSPFGR